MGNRLKFVHQMRGRMAVQIWIWWNQRSAREQMAKSRTKNEIPFLIAYQSFSRMKEFCKVMYQTQPLGFYLAQKKGK